MIRDSHCCRLCDAPATVADHILAVAEGGSHDLDNGQALCAPCHDIKTRAEQARGRARAQQNPRPSSHLVRPTGKHPGML